jgi:hypothetical protein
MRASVLAFVLVVAACQQRTEMVADKQSCVTCHAPEYKAAKDHVDMKPNTCGICHSQSVWAPSRLDHPWPLVGAHAKGNCLWCHRGEPPKFKGTKKECWGCHKQEFARSEYPDHETFQHTCEDCHSEVSWSPALSNAKLPPPIPTVVDIPDAGPPTITDAGVEAGAKPIPTVIPTIIKKPPPKKDSGVDIITHPSGHRGGGEDE